MEEHRRTEAGRVRTAREMVDFFFPRGPQGVDDKIFLHIPPEVRGPIVSDWGVRGAKSAVRDTDEKIKQVVADALAAGDIDEAIFEEGVNAQVLIDWAPLSEWWQFWRTGKLTGVAIQKALAVARELGLFDDKWFLLNVDGRGGKLKGTDTLCDTLSKDQIIAWIRKVHESGDGSPAGLVAALGWETVLTKTSQEALLFALDAFAKKVGLVSSTPAPPEQREEPEDAPGSEQGIPGFEPPGDGNVWSASGSAAEGEGGAGVWGESRAPSPPAQSGTMLTQDEAPLGFGEDDRPRGNPPPVPPRKIGR
jgi:hypothetical protein